MFFVPQVEGRNKSLTQMWYVITDRCHTACFVHNPPPSNIYNGSADGFLPQVHPLHYPFHPSATSKTEQVHLFDLRYSWQTHLSSIKS